VGAGEGHGLVAGGVERAIGPNQEETRLGKQVGFHNPGGGFASAGGDIEPPIARCVDLHAVPQSQIEQSPLLFGLIGAFLGIRAEGDNADTAFHKLFEASV